MIIIVFFIFTFFEASLLDLIDSILIFFSILIKSTIRVYLLDLIDSIFIFFNILIELIIKVFSFLFFKKKEDPPLSLKIFYFNNISNIANFILVLIVIKISLFFYNTSSNREIYKSLFLIICLINSLIFRLNFSILYFSLLYI